MFPREPGPKKSQVSRALTGERNRCLGKPSDFAARAGGRELWITSSGSCGDNYFLARNTQPWPSCFSTFSPDRIMCTHSAMIDAVVRQKQHHTRRAGDVWCQTGGLHPPDPLSAIARARTRGASGCGARENGWDDICMGSLHIPGHSQRARGRRGDRPVLFRAAGNADPQKFSTWLQPPLISDQRPAAPISDQHPAAPIPDQRPAALT
eukprot:gene12788-biopygen16963